MTNAPDARAATPGDLDLRALDREIAERLGWRFEKQPDKLILITDPSGKQYRHTQNYLQGAGEFPHYSTDLNAAITLIGDLWFQCRNDPTFDWYVTLMDDNGLQRSDTSLTLALAICRAWLAYTDTAAAGDALGAGE